MLGLASCLAGLLGVLTAGFPIVGVPLALVGVVLGGSCHLRALLRREGAPGLAMIGWVAGLLALAVAGVFVSMERPVGR